MTTRGASPGDSAANKLITLADVSDLVDDTMLVGIGGVVLRRKPMAVIARLCRDGVAPLRVASFLASLDVEWLAAHRAIRELTTGYVGLETLGTTPAWNALVEAGEVTVREYSELMFISGLRAAAIGLPFLPSRGAAGSDLAADASLRTVPCPYTGETLWAMPALRPDVTFLHAERADALGNVDAPSERDFLWDADATLARASRRVVVSVEKIVPTEQLRAPTLFAHEVAHVLEVPRGAAPSEVPGVYGADFTGLAAYQQAVARGSEPLSALRDAFPGLHVR
ncbi:MAG: CoA transferase subunit A [Ilumatobacteraceae bacterium]